MKRLCAFALRMAVLSCSLVVLEKVCAAVLLSCNEKKLHATGIGLALAVLFCSLKMPTTVSAVVFSTFLLSRVVKDEFAVAPCMA